MLDLLVKNATLPDGRQGMSIAVQNGRIVEVTAGLDAPAHETLDAGAYLLSPHFVDPHFHMDATLSYGLPRINESGTLLEGIALWGELKPLLTAEALIERALTYCDWAVAKGLLAIRSHVDTSDPSLLAVDALLEVKKRVAPYIDLQLVAFPQDGMPRTQGGVDNLRRALDKGVSVVGGIPHFERTTAEGAARATKRAGDLLIYQNGGTGYVARDSITASTELIDKWKIYVGRAAPGTGNRDTYQVIVAAGSMAGIGMEALPPVRRAIGSGFESKTITLSCGKLTTGVTVAQWSSMLMLRNLKSPETYFQAAFRVQSPWSIKNPNGDNPNEEEILKPVCFVFDFAPTRALRQLSEYGIGLSPNESNPENAVRDLVAFLPVLAFDGANMTQIDAGGITHYGLYDTVVARD